MRMLSFSALGGGALLLLALTLGGGTRQGLWSDAAVQLGALPFLAVLVLTSPLRRQRRPGLTFALSIIVAVVAVPLLQLLPWPPGIWEKLPGRSSVAAAFPEAGLSMPWLGISLNPGATWRALYALIPPIAVFLATVAASRRERRIIVFGLVAFGFVSVLLGLLQLAQGSDSALRFYAISNPSETVGFFANRNHYAALLYCCLPFTAAVATGFAVDRSRETWVVLALCVVVFVSLLLGLGMSRSRAGLGLAMMGGAVSLLIAIAGAGRPGGKRASRLLFIGTVVAFVLVLQFASIGILQRLEVDVAEDLRWEFARTTLRAIPSFLPLGSGIGTFVDIYPMFEGPQQVYGPFVNHAHNDYVELFLEAGVFFPLFFLAFLGWFAIAGSRAWLVSGTRSISALDRSLPKAAATMILLLLLHSMVDYPLRTTALSSLFAFACALLISPLKRREEVPTIAR